MSSIVEQIENEIASFQAGAVKSNTGRIVAIADGVAKLEGLSGAMYNEMIDFSQGVFGIALNLEEDEVGCVILGDYSKLKEGDEASTTGRLLSVPVGMGLLGRVVDAIGNPLDGKGPINSSETYPVDQVAPGIIPRKSVDQPMQTGIMSIDSMIPIGRGQRELIIGDRSTGKTTIAIDTIINQAKINNQHRNEDGTFPENFRPVYSIYVAVGQKKSNIARTIAVLERAGAMEYTIIVAASAGDNPANQYIAPFSGASMGEFFMNNGMDALIVYDDLSKQAVAYRQISLVLKRPSGREAYPGDVFYLHSRLLERSARVDEDNGNGSLTALPIIETQAGDVSAYIPTNVISITDGQIFLDTGLFNSGIRPAINVGLSVSRVGGAAQTKAMKKVAGKLRLELAQFKELEAFAQFASDLDAATQQQITRGKKSVQILVQDEFAPLSVGEQVSIIFAAGKGLLDDIDDSKIVDFKKEWFEYFAANNKELKATLDKGDKWDEDIIKQLQESLNKFKENLFV